MRRVLKWEVGCTYLSGTTMRMPASLASLSKGSTVYLPPNMLRRIDQHGEGPIRRAKVRTHGWKNKTAGRLSSSKLLVVAYVMRSLPWPRLSFAGIQKHWCRCFQQRSSMASAVSAALAGLCLVIGNAVVNKLPRVRRSDKAREMGHN